MQQAPASCSINQLASGDRTFGRSKAGWVANAKTNTNGMTTKANPVPTLAASAALTSPYRSRAPAEQ